LLDSRLEARETKRELVPVWKPIVGFQKVQLEQKTFFVRLVRTKKHGVKSILTLKIMF
jgi:hypothetical protein